MLRPRNADNVNIKERQNGTSMTVTLDIQKEAKTENFALGKRIWTSSARAAMLHILQSCLSLDKRGILLPSYIGLSAVEGSGVFDPIRDSGISSEFYKVDSKLRPDLYALEEQLKGGKFQLVFLIHYFGCPQVDVRAFCELCRKYDARVIEDCAHTITGGIYEPRLGSYGNFCIHSIHKSTTSQAGGFFVDHSDVLAKFPVAPEHQIDLDSLGIYANTDLYKISLSRRKNYQIVASWINEIAGSSPVAMFFTRLGENDVPLNCPIMVRDGLRESLYFKLIERGVAPTALYHTLIPEIDHDQYPDSYTVSSNIINLPTHECIDESDMRKYEDALKESIIEVVRYG